MTPFCIPINYYQFSETSYHNPLQEIFTCQNATNLLKSFKSKVKLEVLTFPSFYDKIISTEEETRAKYGIAFNLCDTELSVPGTEIFIR